MAKLNQIFLCYAKEDEQIVSEVYEFLKKSGVVPWMDKKDLLPGQQWELEIANAIRNSKFVLLFFSKISVSKRGYIQKEFKIALDVYDQMPEGHIFLIPIRLDACEIPDRFKELQYCDLSDVDSFHKLLQVTLPLAQNLEKLWIVTFSADFAEILLKFAEEENGVCRAREILNMTQYTIWKKLLHWDLVESPKKGLGKLTERGRKFLLGELDIPIRLGIRDNNVVYQSHERANIKRYYTDKHK